MKSQNSVLKQESMFQFKSSKLDIVIVKMRTMVPKLVDLSPTTQEHSREHMFYLLKQVNTVWFIDRPQVGDKQITLPMPLPCLGGSGGVLLII